MTDSTSNHKPEHGDDDLDMAMVATVVLSGAFIFLVLVLGLRAVVHTTMAHQHQAKVVEPDHNALVDHRIEQRVLLTEYALNADGLSGRIPIEEAMALVVEEHAAAQVPEPPPVDDQGPDQTPHP